MTASTGESSEEPGRRDEDFTKYAKDLLKDTREELVRADTKASLLLAASGVVVGALLNGLLSGKWSPSELDNSIEWMWWLAVAIAASAIVALGSAVYPRTTRRGTKPGLVAYYGDVINTPEAELKERVDITSSEISEAIVDQVLQISKIVARKYNLVRLAMCCLATAAVLSIASVLLNEALR